MKTKLLSALAISALLFASCSNDDDNNTLEVNDGRVKFSSGITATPQTKVATDNAGNSTWNINDPIGIYMVANGTTTVAENAENIPYKATTAAASTSFTPLGATAIYYPVNTPAKVDFIAYHPYESSVANWVYPVDVSTQTPQTGIDLMYATADNSGTGYDKNSTNVNFAFDHQLVKLIINVSTGAGVTGTVSAVSITGMNTSAEFDLTGTAGLTDLGTPQAITPYTATVGTKYEAILLPAATLSAANTVTFTTSASETFTWPMSDDITGLVAGSIYVYNITLTKYAVNAAGNITNWTVGSTGTGTAD